MCRIFLISRKIVSTALILLWFLSVIFLTFEGPFNGTGNGYFGTWFAALCATAIWYKEFVGEEMKGRSIRRSFSFKPMDERGAPTYATNMGATPAGPSAQSGGIA